eukprot:TRINITY_DN682_c0_g2_i1.p1 TRINITY_DN682_c0_g2~~TRINITY_DN682_c0_g2_i1.p1  ORF type:complete len:2198 (-),score=956.94 TRINITY_DN682_c0_g2_i1:231-6824(-)
MSKLRGNLSKSPRDTTKDEDDEVVARPTKKRVIKDDEETENRPVKAKPVPKAKPSKVTPKKNRRRIEDEDEFVEPVPEPSSSSEAQNDEESESSSSSDSDSSSSSKSEPPPRKSSRVSPRSAKARAAAPPTRRARKNVVQEESESVSDESDEEEREPVKKPRAKPKAKAKPSPKQAVAEDADPLRRTALGLRTKAQKVNYKEMDYGLSDDAEDMPTKPSKAQPSGEPARPKSFRSRRKGVAASDGEQSDEEEAEIEESEVLGLDHKTVEKILAERVAADGSGAKEYLVKFKQLSYLHVDWMGLDFFLKDRLGKARLQRWLTKDVYAVRDDDEVFDPACTEVDKIIALDKKYGRYLVKWKSLPYQDCTWELLDDFKDDAKIAEFERYSKVPSATDRMKGGARPKASSFKTLTESPAYKDEHSLRPYQLEGLNWLLFCWHEQRNSILADEMGLGKTVQSVSIVNHLATRFGIRGPFLVIAPLSTIMHWKREFIGWTDLNTVVYHGNQESRDVIHEHEWYFNDELGKPISKKVYKFQVIVTTYETVLAEKGRLSAVPWRYIVVDEAHRLKNATSKLSEALRDFKYETLLLLTGTPIQNNTNELWTLLNFIDRERFSSLEEFQADFGDLKQAEQVTKLHEVLAPYMLRRMKEHVEKSIAPKEETIIEVELTIIQKQYYRAIYERNFQFLKAGASGANVPNLLNIMMELRKCCNHPYLVKGVELEANKSFKTHDEIVMGMVNASGKLVLIDKLLPKLRSGGHRVLIFSQMVRVLDILEDFLNYRGYSHERLDGTIRGSDRQAAIDRFSKPDSDTFVFLLSTRAGGLGINLTAADTVIIFDSDWNPQNDIQAQARCHRIGQKQLVKVYRLITRGTYEYQMFQRANMKLGLDQAVLHNLNAKNPEAAEAGNPTLLMDKKTINSLLKNGAYDLLSNDDTSKAFCEDDIDSILERSKTITHDSTAGAAGGLSSFSKASFASTQTTNVDVDDPDFWNKVLPNAKKSNPLIQAAPRDRKKVTRYAPLARDGLLDASDDSQDEDFENDETAPVDDVPEGPISKTSKISQWTIRTRAQFRTALMQFGYGRWDLIREKARIETANDKLVKLTHAMLRRSLQAARANEDEVLMETVQAYIAAHPVSEDGPKGDRKDDDMTLEARFDEQIAKNYRNFILRLELLQSLAHWVEGEGYPLLDQLPTTRSPEYEWWSLAQDKDLLIGTWKYGFGNFDALRRAPELSFLTSCPPPPPEEEATADAAGKTEAAVKSEDVPAGEAADKPAAPTADADMTDAAPASAAEAKPAVVKEEQKPAVAAPAAKPTAPSADVKSEAATTPVEADDAKPVLTVKADDGEVKDESGEPKADGESATESKAGGEEPKEVKIEWPGVKWLNSRIRRLLKTLDARDKKNSARRQKKEEKDAEKAAKAKKKVEASAEWIKREKLDLIKALNAFGHPGGDDQDVSRWNKIRDVAKLTKKTNEMVEEYVQALLLHCKHVMSSSEEPAPTAPATMGTFDDMTKAKAEKLVERLKLLKGLDTAVAMPDFEARVRQARKGTGFCSWWGKGADHDIAFLRGVHKHGFGHWDAIIADEELPFHVQAKNMSAKPKQTQLELKKQAAAAAAAAAASPAPAAAPSTPKAAGTPKSETPKPGDAETPMDVDWEKDPHDDTAPADGGKDADGAKDADADPADGDAPKDTDGTPSKDEKKKRERTETVAEQIGWPKDAHCQKRLQYLVELVLTPKPSYSAAGTERSSATPASGKKVKQGTLNFRRGEDSDYSENEERLLRYDSDGKSSSRKSGGSGKKRKKRDAETVRPFVDVPRDAAGNVKYPIQLSGVLQVLELGEIVPDNEHWHNEKYIWPRGFKSIRLYDSMFERGKRIDYTCEIIGNKEPIFRITPEDDPSQAVEARAASGAWKTVLSRVSMVRGDAVPKTAISGPEHYGFAQPAIAKLIQELPGADRCRNYKMQKFGSSKHARRDEGAEDNSEAPGSPVQDSPLKARASPVPMALDAASDSESESAGAFSKYTRKSVKKDSKKSSAKPASTAKRAREPSTPTPSDAAADADVVVEVAPAPAESLPSDSPDVVELSGPMDTAASASASTSNYRPMSEVMASLKLPAPSAPSAAGLPPNPPKPAAPSKALGSPPAKKAKLAEPNGRVMSTSNGSNTQTFLNMYFSQKKQPDGGAAASVETSRDSDEPDSSHAVDREHVST